MPFNVFTFFSNQKAAGDLRLYIFYDTITIAVPIARIERATSAV
jgi:hypothetical protein